LERASSRVDMRSSWKQHGLVSSISDYFGHLVNTSSSLLCLSQSLLYRRCKTSGENYCVHAGVKLLSHKLHARPVPLMRGGQLGVVGSVVCPECDDSEKPLCLACGRLGCFRG
jgi:hypothetical protein